jgi:hypothetical protein
MSRITEKGHVIQRKAWVEEGMYITCYCSDQVEWVCGYSTHQIGFAEVLLEYLCMSLSVAAFSGKSASSEHWEIVECP